VLFCWNRKSIVSLEPELCHFVGAEKVSFCWSRNRVCVLEPCHFARAVKVLFCWSRNFVVLLEPKNAVLLEPEF
jgi:hypothetical protein